MCGYIVLICPDIMVEHALNVLFILLPLLISTGIPVMYCLLEVVSVCPEKLASRFVDKIDWIKVSISLIYVFILM